MSSFITTVMLMLFLLVLACVCATGQKLMHNKKYKVSCGMNLAWSRKLQAVVVLSRLLDSPAGRAGVEGKMIVRSVHGVLLDTVESFVQWQKVSPPKLGVKEFWVFEGPTGLHQVEMVPELLQASFNFYWHPDRELLSEEDKEKIKSVLEWDGEIGEYSSRMRIRWSAIKEVYGLA